MTVVYRCQGTDTPAWSQLLDVWWQKCSTEKFKIAWTFVFKKQAQKNNKHCILRLFFSFGQFCAVCFFLCLFFANKRQSHFKFFRGMTIDKRECFSENSSVKIKKNNRSGAGEVVFPWMCFKRQPEFNQLIFMKLYSVLHFSFLNFC